jgi:hypothetical protein
MVRCPIKENWTLQIDYRGSGLVALFVDRDALAVVKLVVYWFEKR